MACGCHQRPRSALETLFGCCCRYIFYLGKFTETQRSTDVTQRLEKKTHLDFLQVSNLYFMMEVKFLSNFRIIHWICRKSRGTLASCGSDAIIRLIVTFFAVFFAILLERTFSAFLKTDVGTSFFPSVSMALKKSLGVWPWESRNFCEAQGGGPNCHLPIDLDKLQRAVFSHWPKTPTLKILKADRFLETELRTV